MDTTKLFDIKEEFYSINADNELNEFFERNGIKNVCGSATIMNGKELFICTCGHHEAYENGMEKCPACGSDYFIPYIDEYCVIHADFEHEVLMNDENMFAMSILVIEMILQNEDDKISMRLEEGETYLFCYDRKKEFAFMTEGSGYWLKDYPFVYKNCCIYSEKNEYMKRILEHREDFQHMYWYSHGFNKKTGADEIMDIICQNVGIKKEDVFQVKTDNLQDGIYQVIEMTDFKCYNEFKNIPKEEKNLGNFNINGKKAFMHHYFNLCDAGVNMMGKTIEEVFGVSRVALNKLYNIKHYLECKDSISGLLNMSFNAELSSKLESIDLGCWKYLVEISKKSGIDIELIISHVYSGVKNGFGAMEVINTDNDILRYDESGKDLYKNYTKALKRKWYLMSVRRMDMSDFEKIHKNPTLDNAWKVLCSS